MTTHKTLLYCCLLFAFQVPSIAHTADTTFALPINLTLGREIKPFDEYLLDATSVRISIVTMGKGKSGRILQNDTVRSALSGICAVAAVTEDGQEALKTITIRNAQTRYQGSVADIVQTGAKVKAQFSDVGNVYSIGDDTLSAEVTADLSGLIRSEGGQKSGRIMDPNKPVSPGDTWTIDTAAFAATLGPPPATQKRIVKGSVTFTRIDTVNSVPIAVVTMDASAHNAFAEIEGMQAMNSTVVAHIELYVPLDQRYPPVRVKSTTILGADVGEVGQTVHFDYHVTDDLEFRR